MDLIPERKTETVWVPQTSITERGVLEIFPRRAAMEGALMGIGISRESPQFVPEGFQFFRVLRGKFFYGESRVDEHRIARLDINNEIGADFRPDGAGGGKGPVFSKYRFNGVGNGKTHEYSSFSGLLYSRMTGE
jgi:hypothetical protein